MQHVGIKPGIKCPSCGAECPAGERFCVKCGATVTKTQRQEPLPTQQANKCPGCGQVITDNPNFCTRCGRKLR
jgi:DNA-directed RNA polymerase subunit RPC12/RpoP